jgi:hypothetical protein
MKITKNIFFILVSCLLIQGCVSSAKTMKLVPQVLRGQRIIDQEGTEAVISHKRKASVALRPPSGKYSSEGRPIIFVSLYGTGKSFDFSTEDIQVSVDGNPHRVLTHDVLAAEIKSKKEMEVAAIELRYEAQYRKVANEGYRYLNEDTAAPRHAIDIGKDTSQYGYKYDIEEVAAGQLENEAEKEFLINAIKNEKEKTLTALDAIILKKTTLLPDRWYHGYIALEKIPDPFQPHEIKILVEMDGEEHEFLFNHSKIQ